MTTLERIASILVGPVPLFDADSVVRETAMATAQKIIDEISGGDLFMCKVDFEDELGNARGGNVVYPSISNLLEERKCVAECGYVKVGVFHIETIQETNYGNIGEAGNE